MTGGSELVWLVPDREVVWLSRQGTPPESESTHPAAFPLGLPSGLGEGLSPVTRQANELA